MIILFVMSRTNYNVLCVLFYVKVSSNTCLQLDECEVNAHWK